MKKKNAKQFSLFVANADGPIQLRLMNEDSGTGTRLLGSKGSPDVEEIYCWRLSKEELNNLIYEMNEILGEP